MTSLNIFLLPIQYVNVAAMQKPTRVAIRDVTPTKMAKTEVLGIVSTRLRTGASNPNVGIGISEGVSTFVVDADTRVIDGFTAKIIGRFVAKVNGFVPRVIDGRVRVIDGRVRVIDSPVALIPVARVIDDPVERDGSTGVVEGVAVIIWSLPVGFVAVAKDIDGSAWITEGTVMEKTVEVVGKEEEVEEEAVKVVGEEMVAISCCCRSRRMYFDID